MDRVKKVWKNVRIKTKIVIIYLFTLLISVSITYAILYHLNSVYIEKEVGVIGTQTLEALGGNLKLIFENVTQFSDYVYFDDDIQEALKGDGSAIVTADNNRKITRSLSNTIVAGDYISGVYVFDRHLNCYRSYKKAPKKIDTKIIPDTTWYHQLEKQKGNGFFIHQSEGVIEYWENNDYITYVREIRDKNTYEPRALLLVTIDPVVIQNYFKGVHKTYESEFCIVDHDGNYIVKPNAYEDMVRDLFLEQQGKMDQWQMHEFADGKKLVIMQDIGIQDWKLIGIFGMDAMWAVTPYYGTLVIIILCLNAFFAVAASIWLTRLIFHPLSKVEKHMRMVDEGKFILMQVDDSQNEITNLQKIYNDMTQSIQNLLERVKEEEKIIARNELDIIMAQINPHFLYNTLDAASALALTKDYDNCFKMMQAIGNFYRNSLNSGLDYICVRDEVECIKSYITILNIRYDNKIRMEYNVDENVLEEKVLKLILQPLVENAVYHGIKENVDWGHISVKIFGDEDEIILIVADDGKGMSEERIKEVLSGKAATGRSGFGLYSLKQRLILYYGISEPLMINSDPGVGTEVIVRTKRREE
ncbi:MAG: sensor histidine kinase [Agathobacter sp.]